MPVAELIETRTPIELEDLPKGFELIDGIPTEMPEMGFRSGQVGLQFAIVLADWCRQQGMGVVTGPESSFRCFPNRPKQIRKPDVAVLWRDPKTFVMPDPHCLEVPVFVAEILSRTNTQTDIADRVEDFLTAGTKLIWVIDPIRREALVYHPDDTILKIRESGTLDGENALPGFRLPLAAILPPKASSGE